MYSWGRNSNFTLAHGDDKERNTPEVVDLFTRMLRVSIKEVSESNRELTRSMTQSEFQWNNAALETPEITV